MRAGAFAASYPEYEFTEGGRIHHRDTEDTKRNGIVVGSKQMARDARAAASDSRLRDWGPDRRKKSNGRGRPFYIVHPWTTAFLIVLRVMLLSFYDAAWRLCARAAMRAGAFAAP